MTKAFVELLRALGILVLFAALAYGAKFAQTLM